MRKRFLVEYHISNLIMKYERIKCKIIQRRQMKEENKSKDTIESQINIDVSCIFPRSELRITILVWKVSTDRKNENIIFIIVINLVKKMVRWG